MIGVRPDHGLIMVNAPPKSGRVPGRERARPADLAEAFCQISIGAEKPEAFWQLPTATGKFKGVGGLFM